MSHRSCLRDKRSIFISRIIRNSTSLSVQPILSQPTTYVTSRQYSAFLGQCHRPSINLDHGTIIAQRSYRTSSRNRMHSPFETNRKSQHDEAIQADDFAALLKWGGASKAQRETPYDGLDEDLIATEARSTETSHPAHGPRYPLLFKTIGKHLPYAGPNTILLQLRTNESEEGSGEDNARFSLALVNEDFNVRCTREFVAAEQNQVSINRIYDDLIMEYSRTIKDRLQSRNAKGQIESPVMSKIRNALRLKPLMARISPVDIDPRAGTNYELFRVQIYSGNEPLGQAQIWPHKAVAERLACNSADADVLKRAEQRGLSMNAFQRVIRPSFLPAKPYDVENVKARANPFVYDATISQDCMSAMLQVLRDARTHGLPDEVTLPALQSPSALPYREQPTSKLLQAQSARMKRDFIMQRSFQLTTIETQQSKLPVRQPDVASRICELVKTHDVLVLVSETGSGKTTQLPQILLEDFIMSERGAFCNVICTQPRRIAATSVAKRVAYERNTTVGGSVGHQVRFDAQGPSQNGSIKYTTAGVLLKNLQDDVEKAFSQASHIVVDEVHERDLTVDLLMAVLRDLLRKRLSQGKKCPKVVLMSATMESVDFEKYFSETRDESSLQVASITIPGRAYSVTTKDLDSVLPELSGLYNENVQIMQMLRDSREYLAWEDEFADEWRNLQTYNLEPDNLTAKAAAAKLREIESDPVRNSVVPYALIHATIAHILVTSDKGDILVFLPGMKEIDQLAESLATIPIDDQDFGDVAKVRIFKLHSILHETNASVFDPIPEGCRRVILATNIAQTSITLPDVVHVVDSGKRREMRYDSVTRKNDFVSTWIDQATSLQRKGRAGRVQNGYYWAMFTGTRFKSMPKSADPEIRTSDLTTMSLVLKSHSNEIDLQEFFAGTLDPPSPAVVAACAQELREMNMLTAEDTITPLGKFCADFPLHPAKARGLLFGILFECLQPLMIVASHDVNTPLISSNSQKKDILQTSLSFAGITDDDRYAFINAFQKYDKAIQDGSVEDIDVLEKQHLRRDVRQDMLFVGQQLYNIMVDYGLLPPGLCSGDRTSHTIDSVFQKLSHLRNANAHQTNLFKAIALTVNDTNLAVWNEQEQSWIAKNVKCTLRPYSVNTMKSLKLLERVAYRKTGEVVGFSSMVRNVLAGSRPFLVETSSITPLMAILFGGPVALVDEKTIEIDGWLRYRLNVTAHEDTTHDSALRNVSPAMVILELRKAIDRFLILAFADLKNLSRLPTAQKTSINQNRMFKPNPIRQAIVSGLIDVLDADAQHWDEAIHFTSTNSTR